MLHIVSDGDLRERSAGDESTAFQRIEGDPGSSTIVFLPWCMPYRLAMARRIVPENYLACYEMPRAIVSSEPEMCIRALHAVVDDATRSFDRSHLTPDQLQVVGLSIGRRKIVLSCFGRSGRSDSVGEPGLTPRQGPRGREGIPGLGFYARARGPSYD
jgi:hypothetical protein